jgi:hypothetical protein
MQPRSLGGMVVIGSVGSATPFWEEGTALRGVFGEYSDNHLIIFFINIHYNSSHLIYLHIHQLSLPFKPPAPNQGAPEPSTSAFPLLRFSPTQIYKTQSSFATQYARSRACLRSITLLNARSWLVVPGGGDKCYNWDWEEEFGGGGPSGDDDPRSDRTIVLHEREWVKEADEDQIVEQEEQREENDEGRKEGMEVKLGRPCTPEFMILEMHSPEEGMTWSLTPRQSVINIFFQRLSTLSTQLDSAIEL